jgi:hypothetical protein
MSIKILNMTVRHSREYMLRGVMGNDWLMRFTILAIVAFAKPDNKFTLIVARPGADDFTEEDRGKTLVVPLPKEEPKLYAMKEADEIKIMLASEYKL